MQGLEKAGAAGAKARAGGVGDPAKDAPEGQAGNGAEGAASGPVPEPQAHEPADPAPAPGSESAPQAKPVPGNEERAASDFKGESPLENKAGPSMASFALRILNRIGAGGSRLARELERGLADFERREREERGEEEHEAEGPSRFFHLLKRRRDEEEARSGQSRARRRQIATAVLCAALAFAGYYAWQSHFGPSEAELSFEDLRSRLPLKIDRYTSITKAELGDRSMEITVVKTEDAFSGLGEAQMKARLDEFGRRARGLCSSKLFRGIISGGRPLHVSLDFANGRHLRSYSVDSCPPEPGA